MLESARVSANRQDIFSRRLTEQANISNEVLELWFDPANRHYWFEASPDFDELVRQRLINLYASAAEGCLDDWKDEPNGALALCILFDQVPRNIFRGSPQAFATDPQALSVARHILTLGFDQSYPTDDHRVLCYLPFEHSEDIEHQRLAVQLLSEKTADNLSTDYAQRHLEIIARFGRFPHRNAVLGRTSTPAELEFLKMPGSSF
jgi:uncharacterized protein (DUF924 family)